MLSRKAICCAASLSIFAVAALYFGAAPIFSLLLAPMSVAGKVLVPDTVDKAGREAFPIPLVTYLQSIPHYSDPIVSHMSAGHPQPSCLGASAR